MQTLPFPGMSRPHNCQSCRCCRREVDGQVLGEVTQHAQAKHVATHETRRSQLCFSSRLCPLLATGLWLWNMCFSPAFQFVMLASLHMPCHWTIWKHEEAKAPGLFILLPTDLLLARISGCVPNLETGNFTGQGTKCQVLGYCHD